MWTVAMGLNVTDSKKGQSLLAARGWGKNHGFLKGGLIFCFRVLQKHSSFTGLNGFMDMALEMCLIFFPKQFTVGALNATLDLAALALVGVVGFLGSEVVLSPVVSHCLRLSPFMWGVGVGWCGRLLGL